MVPGWLAAEALRPASRSCWADGIELTVHLAAPLLPPDLCSQLLVEIQRDLEVADLGLGRGSANREKATVRHDVEQPTPKTRGCSKGVHIPCRDRGGGREGGGGRDCRIVDLVLGRDEIDPLAVPAPDRRAAASARDQDRRTDCCLGGRVPGRQIDLPASRLG